jgi:hypothetical protein
MLSGDNPDAFLGLHLQHYILATYADPEILTQVRALDHAQDRLYSAPQPGESATLRWQRQVLGPYVQAVFRVGFLTARTANLPRRASQWSSQIFAEAATADRPDNFTSQVLRIFQSPNDVGGEGPFISLANAEECLRVPHPSNFIRVPTPPRSSPRLSGRSLSPFDWSALNYSYESS